MAIRFADRLSPARHSRAVLIERLFGVVMRYGWKVSTCSSHENGQTPEVPLESAIAYGNAFKVSPSWFLTAEGPMGA